MIGSHKPLISLVIAFRRVLFAVVVVVVLLGFLEYVFPYIAGVLLVEVREDEVEDVGVPVCGVALDAFFDVLGAGVLVGCCIVHVRN